MKTLLPKHTFLVIEDDPHYRLKLSEMLNSQTGWYVAAGFERIEDAVNGEFSPDLILLDIRLPGVSGIEGIPQLKGAFPRAQILLLSGYENAQLICDAFAQGVNGYLLKRSRSEIISGVADALKGEVSMSPVIALRLRDEMAAGRLRSSKHVDAKSRLSPMEYKVIYATAEGMTHEEAAEALGITLSAVKNAVRRIYAKYGTNSALQAIKEMLGENPLPPPEG